MNNNSTGAGDSNNPAYIEWQAETRKWLLNLYEKTCAEREIWAVETLKHIALVALAGLGGVFALVGAGRVNIAMAIWAAALFSLGSALCVIAMYIGSIIRGRYLQHFEQLLDRLSANEAFGTADFHEPTKVKFWNRTAQASGWTAAICTITAGIFLFQALLSSTALHP